VFSVNISDVVQEREEMKSVMKRITIFILRFIFSAVDNAATTKNIFGGAYSTPHKSVT
jgi:hypothetical protein